MVEREPGGLRREQQERSRAKSRGEKLDHREDQDVAPLRKAVHDHDMHGKQQGAKHRPQLALPHRTAGATGGRATADEIGPEQGERDAEPDREPRPPPAEHPSEERHDQDVVRGDEGRNAGRRGLDADLLRRHRGKKDDSGKRAAERDRAVRTKGAVLDPIPRPDDARKENAREEIPETGERKGPVMLRAGFLGDKGRSPDEGAEENQQGTDEPLHFSYSRRSAFPGAPWRTPRSS